MKAGAGNEPVNTTSPGSHGKSLHLIIHKVSEKFTWRRSECKYRLSCYISLPVCMSYVESCFNYKKAICSIGHQEVVG